MYISKPKKGFLLPVTYMKNEYLYDGELEIKSRSENIENEIIEEDTELFLEKRDRLFEEDDDLEEKVKVKKYHEDFKGILVFDDIDVSETRKFTEVNEEKIGKLVFENNDLQNEIIEREDNEEDKEVIKNEEIKEDTDNHIREDSKENN